MIQQAISLSSILKKAQSISVTIRKQPIIAIRLNKIESNLFIIFKLLRYTLIDLTASNHPERYFCNTIYYIYEGLMSHIYLSVLTFNHGSVYTASITNFSALVAERECSEMFGIIFEKSSRLTKIIIRLRFYRYSTTKTIPPFWIYPNCIHCKKGTVIPRY